MDVKLERHGSVTELFDAIRRLQPSGHADLKYFVTERAHTHQDLVDLLYPEVRAELRSAALWCDERRSGLGDEFIAEVSAALARIGNTPESYPAWAATRIANPLIRRATIQRFPYVIAFEKHEKHVLVLAVAHAKRRPLYWLTRTSP